ncbi:tetratricopeptide repeat protein 32 [Corythoichthys intestinalis]|uniref:tetratricopeptide repeat protein 32 n=1 Tax=Corythoichthys intestinalis TaxID=161448 RepID=UPI0025A5D4D0|nr:tetratricopeptide repeat protein 32 [Corythoichthys intestinalis]XP_061806172.1 tetratricopeptide repeat protein 32-like [Nerophis lumbriciformis]
MADDCVQLFQSANIEFKKQNFKRAEELYNQFISSCSHSREREATHLATAYNNRGQIKYFRVDFDEAVEDYTSAIQTDDKFEVAFYNRGLIHYRLGFFEDAVKDFRQALKLNEAFEDAKVGLRRALLDQQDKTNRGY